MIIIFLLAKMWIQKKKIQHKIIDISHKIQTPLTIMKGELDLFDKKEDKERLIDSLNNNIDKISRYTSKNLTK